LETVLRMEAGLPVDELVRDAVVNTETREFAFEGLVEQTR